METVRLEWHGPFRLSMITNHYDNRYLDYDVPTHPGHVAWSQRGLSRPK